MSDNSLDGDFIIVPYFFSNKYRLVEGFPHLHAFNLGYQHTIRARYLAGIAGTNFIGGAPSADLSQQISSHTVTVHVTSYQLAN